MVNIVPISTERHADKAWLRPNGFQFVSTQAVVPLVGAEFGRACLGLPIGFVQQADTYVPAAVMSPIAGRNLLVGPAGQWLGSYIPAALRSYPFRLGQVPETGQITLCIDEDSGTVVDADGGAEDFLDAEGKPTPQMQAMLNFMLEMEKSRRLTERAVKSLTDAGLIRPWQFEVTIDGEPTPAAGIFCVNETDLNVLDDVAFLGLRRTGALGLAYLQLASMNQIAMLQHLAGVQQQLVAAHQKQRQIASLDELFSQGFSETLRFN